MSGTSVTGRLPPGALRAAFLALLCLASSGCRTAPLAARTSAFATAATVTASQTDDAYELVERTFRDAETARMAANYDTAGFDTSTLKPFLPEADRRVREQVIAGLRSYAELLAETSGNAPATGVDTASKSVGASLQTLSVSDLTAAKLTSQNAGIVTTALDVLGRTLIERKRRRDLPGILHQMQQPIETICALLAQDIGDPQLSGLRNQLHNSYLDLLREQKNFIADNGAKLSPSEKREQILVLPHLASSEFDADKALAETQTALLQLARTHTALAQTAAQKDAPAFRLQMEQLSATAQKLGALYTSLPPHQ